MKTTITVLGLDNTEVPIGEKADNAKQFIKQMLDYLFTKGSIVSNQVGEVLMWVDSIEFSEGTLSDMSDM